MNVFGVGSNPGGEGPRPELPRLRVSPTAVGKVRSVADATRDLDARLAQPSARDPRGEGGAEERAESRAPARDEVDIRFAGDLGERLEVRFKGTDGRETSVEIEKGRTLPLRSMRLEPPPPGGGDADAPGDRLDVRG